MGKIENQRKYMELLEENYLMLKVIKTSSDTMYLLEDSLNNIGDSLQIIKKEIEPLGDLSHVLDTAEILVEDLKKTARSMAEVYMLLDEITEDEEDADGNT